MAASLPSDAGNIGVDVVAQMEAHHAEVGAYLLGLWGFPNPIVEAVAFHHIPSLAATEGLSLAGLVHVANYLVHQRDGTSGAAVGTTLEPGFLESRGLLQRLPEWQAALENLNLEEAVQ